MRTSQGAFPGHEIPAHENDLRNSQSSRSPRPWGAPTIATKKPGNAALRKGRASIEGQIYFITTTTLKRQPLFADFQTARAAAQTFEDKKVLADARLLAWVLMPEHFHGLLALGERHGLPEIMGRLKSASARRANKTIGRQGPLWDRAYYDHALRHEEDLLVTARYLVANPVRAGIVQRVGDYPFWNAIWLSP